LEVLHPAAVREPARQPGERAFELSRSEAEITLLEGSLFRTASVPVEFLAARDPQLAGIVLRKHLAAERHGIGGLALSERRARGEGAAGRNGSGPMRAIRRLSHEGHA